jgi:hypothetical protein
MTGSTPRKGKFVRIGERILFADSDESHNGLIETNGEGGAVVKMRVARPEELDAGYFQSDEDGNITFTGRSMDSDLPVRRVHGVARSRTESLSRNRKTD